jgi:hypothetical protein
MIEQKQFEDSVPFPLICAFLVRASVVEYGYDISRTGVRVDDKDGTVYFVVINENDIDAHFFKIGQVTLSKQEVKQHLELLLEQMEDVTNVREEYSVMYQRLHVEMFLVQILEYIEQKHMLTRATLH